MTCGPDGADRINSYAVVSYMHGQLAEFLDALRAELVAGCDIRAHVTILTPRPLAIDAAEAASAIGSRIGDVPSFHIEATHIRVFEPSNVIYADVGAGSEELKTLHDTLNTGGLKAIEKYKYHPHLTLAQNITDEQVAELKELAERRWEEYRGPRVFHIESLTFVQNTASDQWIDLAQWELSSPAYIR